MFDENEKALMDFLNELGVETWTTEHAQVFTVEEAKALRGELPGAHVKNLFLRDRKKNITLVTLEESQAVDLKALRPVLEAKGGLSFGAPELLMDVMGVIPGSVTPFGLFNDKEKRARFAIDQKLMAADRINIHPLRNDKTTGITPEGLICFLQALNVEPILIDFEALASSET